MSGFVNMNSELRNAVFQLNKGDTHYAPVRLGDQIGRRSKRTFKGIFDFAIQGGAISTIPLYDPVFGKGVALNLPASFIITDVCIDVITALTSGGSATVALTSGQGAGDLLTATAYSSSPFTGAVSIIQLSSAIKVPVTQAQPGSQVSAVVAVAALTAGQFAVHIEGYLSDLF